MPYLILTKKRLVTLNRHRIIETKYHREVTSQSNIFQKFGYLGMKALFGAFFHTLKRQAHMTFASHTFLYVTQGADTGVYFNIMTIMYM